MRRIPKLRRALRPDWATDTGSGINYATALIYAPQGAVSTATYGGIIARSDSYNNRLQPSSLTASANGTTLLSLSYNSADGSGYNNGNVMGITNNLDPTRSFTFTYDQLNRLNTAATTSATATYTDDIWGNLYSVSLTGSPAWQNALSLGITTANQISGDGYDSAGNMTGDGLYNYTYDAEERQTLAAGVTYGYDGDGKRVEKLNSKIYWYGSTGTPLLETDWNGNLQNEYIMLGGSRIARRDASSNVYYYLGDHLGTARVIANSSGTKCYDADFGPYGKEAVYTSTCAQNYKFTGKERDTETGNDYFGARFDESNLGRFMSPDPAGVSPVKPSSPQSLNRYSYTFNSPMTYVDRSGTWPYYIHSEIIDRAFQGLSAHQRGVLKSASARVDSPFHGGWSGEKAYRHAMSPGPDEGSKARAQEQAADWVKSNEDEAKKKQESYEKQRGVGISDAALDSFGNANHTVSDATSPSHEGFQYWDLSDPLSVAIHLAIESTISDEQLARAVEAERKAFEQTFGADRLRQATNCQKGEPICDQSPDTEAPPSQQKP